MRRLLDDYGTALWAICIMALWALMPEPARACTAWDTGVGLTVGRSVSPPLMWAAVWCPPAGGVGEYRMRLHWVRPDSVDVPAFAAALARKDAAWLAAQITDDLTEAELAAINAPEQSALRRSTRPPAAYAHRVAANGATLTRPVYALTNGVRGTKELARVAVGTGCDPAKARAGDYMAFAPAFAVDRVTLCK